MAGTSGKAHSPVRPVFASHLWHGSGTIASMVPPLHRYKALLFDMNETFMFGGDRLGPGEDFDATYRAVGGASLSAEAVAHCVGAAVAGFLADYTNPALVDDFPSLRETLAKHSIPSRHEARLLELVIARHEVGVVPEWAAQVLLTLARSHRLGLVSNLWAPSHHWQPELRRSKVAPVLECQVFSSDTRSIKPSPRLLLQALGMLDLPPQDVLFVGDSLERDIAPAKALGMATCWVTACGGGADVADFCIPSIAALTAVPTPARG